MFKRLFSLAVLSVLFPAAGLAGDPPVSCTPAGGVGCDLRSDFFVFGEGDPAYRIEARITECRSCSAPVGGVFNILAFSTIEFGPYDPALCPAAEGAAALTIDANARSGAGTGGPGGNEPTYIPDNPSLDFLPTLPAPLRTACVSRQNLNYNIPRLKLNGSGGARTEPLAAAPHNASLLLPENVRAFKNALPARTMNLDQFRFTQRLELETSELYGPASTLRLWPADLPFRLGPRRVDYAASRVEFSAPGPGGGGPAAYQPLLPDGTPATGLVPGQIRSCADPLPGNACTTTAVANAGYLFDTRWVPSDAVITVDGLAVRLDFPGGSTMVYETLFPRALHVKFQGPGQVTVEASRIEGGFFSAGQAFQRLSRDRCGNGAVILQHALNAGALRPQIGADGALLAGISDLNDNLNTPAPSDPVAWTYNNATGLGCGTLHVPEVVTPGAAQSAWLDSAVPAVKGRGIYAGLNYNRNRACRSAGGQILDKLCTTNADCQGAGETCVDGGFSPLCPALASVPQWTTTIEGTDLFFNIIPGNPNMADREMAFVMRHSGVSGVFDGGDGDFSFGTPQNGEFQFDLTSFGLAFKAGRSERGDTIVAGSLAVPWPAATDVPFEGMKVCDCGQMDGGRTPDVLIERNLAYWNQDYLPYSLNFSSQNNPDCSTIAATSCGQSSQAATVCVASVMPVQRFSPDVEGAFSLTPQGQAGKLTAWSPPRLEFDRDDDAGGGTQAGYTFDAEQFAFNSWQAAGSPTPALISLGFARYGYVDAKGEIALPFFGLTPAGIKVRRTRDSGLVSLADLHAACDETTSPLCADDDDASFIEARREIAAKTVALPFRVDFVPPSATSDPNDGQDEARRGRGTLLAYAWEDDFDLGAAKVAAGMILRPGQVVTQDADLGPAAALRLWGSLNPSARSRLKSILPAALVDDWGAEYDQALGQLGLPGAQGHLLPLPEQLADQMHASGAIATLAGHPDAQTVFNVEGTAPGASPEVTGSRITGFADLSADQSRVELVKLQSNQDTGGEFYKFDGALLTVDRHVKEGEEPITTVVRRESPGAANTMTLADGQSISFPEGSAGQGLQAAQDDSDSPLTWDVDYDMPGFQFKSLTGTLDLLKGGLSGVGFDKLGATMKFYNDGDWYFSAGMSGNWSGYKIGADFLAGNTTDMTPLQEIDPDVARFLDGVQKFDGVYIGGGFSGPIWNYGCPFRVGIGVELAGWYISESYGGKVRGWIDGTGACIVSVRGDLTLIGGKVNSLVKFKGNFWVAGGIGFCSPEDWDTPADAFDDDFCGVCVGEAAVSGTYPPDDLNLQVDGPEFSCAL